MNCIEVGELMHRKLDFDLSAQEEKELELHLTQCSSCHLIFERLSSLSTQLEQLPHVTPPFSIVDSILPKLMEVEIEEKTLIKQDEEAVTAAQKMNKGTKKKAWLITTTSVAVAAAALILTVNVSPNSSSSENTAQIAISHDALADQEVSEKTRSIENQPEKLDTKVKVDDQYGRTSITSSGQPEKSSPTAVQVDQLKVSVTSQSIIDHSVNNNKEDQLTRSESTNEAEVPSEDTATVRQGGFTALFEEEKTEQKEQMMLLGVEDNNIVYNSPDNKVYVTLVEHSIEIHDYNTAELLKTLEVPIEGEISFVGWHESGVEFYIDVVDANMQTHRLTYTIGM